LVVGNFLATGESYILAYSIEEGHNELPKLEISMRTEFCFGFTFKYNILGL